MTGLFGMRTLHEVWNVRGIVTYLKNVGKKQGEEK